MELKERGNARERVAPIPNAPRNYLRSIPGTFAEFKDKKLKIFEKKAEKSSKSPISHLRLAPPRVGELFVTVWRLANFINPAQNGSVVAS